MQEKFTVHMSLSSFILFCILMSLFFLQNYRLATSKALDLSSALATSHHIIVLFSLQYIIHQLCREANKCNLDFNGPKRKYLFKVCSRNFFLKKKLEVACSIFYYSLYNDSLKSKFLRIQNQSQNSSLVSDQKA